MQHFHSVPEPQSVYTNPNTSQYNAGAPAEALGAAEQRRLQESIEDYLDRVCRPLMDTLPYAARQELRREIAQHLNALVQAYRDSGYSPALATEKALDKFGPPHLVAQKWNPVTIREGQYKRMERWFTGQWQGIAATLALCGATGLLGLMLRHPGTLSPHRLMPRSQAAVVSVATPTSPIRPLTYAAMTGNQDMLAKVAWQQAALDQARTELTAVAARLTQCQMALQNAELIQNTEHFIAHERSADPAIGDILRLRRNALKQQVALECQNLEERHAAVLREEAILESLRSQIAQRGL